MPNTIGKARFPKSVKVGARFRAHGERIHIEDVKGGYQSTCRITLDAIGRYYL